MVTRTVRPIAVLLLGLGSAGCLQPGPRDEPAASAAPGGAPPAAVQLDPPAGSGAFAPSLAAAGGRLLATWLEPLPEGGEGRRHRLLFSALSDSAWSSPSVVHQGERFFANWADFPKVAPAGDGSLYAHWLAKTGEGTYAYSIYLAHSVDGGATWTHLGRLNDDETETEHGFVSFVPEGGGVRAFWLDGRAMVGHHQGAMSLRTAVVNGGAEPAVGPAEVLDERVCECCSTGAALAAAGPLVVYRDRDEAEFRDVSLVRRLAAGWTAPRSVHRDGWEIAGCPVNGPEIVADGDLAAAAWFTGAGEEPRVRAAFSRDGGATFGPPMLIDGEGPLGRVDVALDGRGGAFVCWLGRAEGRARVRVRHVADDGRLGEPLTVAETAASRASGFPRLARLADRLYVAWVETAEGEPSRVRLRAIPMATVAPQT